MSDSTSDSNLKNEFIPIKDRQNQIMTLKEAVKMGAQATLWTKSSDYQFNSQLSAYSDSQNLIYVYLPEDIDSKNFNHYMEKKADADRYLFINVTLLTATIFLKARYIEIDTLGIVLEPPDTIYKVQRRKNFRMPVPDGYTIYCTFSDPVFESKKMKTKIIDLSAGGLAILVTEEDEVNFQPGLLLENIEFNIWSKKILAKGEVRYKQEFPKTHRHKGIKVGIEFTKILEKDQSHIASYIFEESRKYFSNLF